MRASARLACLKISTNSQLGIRTYSVTSHTRSLSEVTFHFYFTFLLPFPRNFFVRTQTFESNGYQRSKTEQKYGNPDSILPNNKKHRKERKLIESLSNGGSSRSGEDST